MKNLTKFMLQNGMNIELSYIQNYKNGFENDINIYNKYISIINEKLDNSKIITNTIKKAKEEFNINFK